MLPIAFQHTFPAPVWRLLFEQVPTASGALAIEWRLPVTEISPKDATWSLLLEPVSVGV